MALSTIQRNRILVAMPEVVCLVSQNNITIHTNCTHMYIGPCMHVLLHPQVLEKSLHLLFTTRNVSLVKNYVQRQCGKVLDGRGNLQEYMFAKEYRGKEYYRPGACVPALELTKYVALHT